MQVSDLKVKNFIQPQIKSLLEEALGRKVRLNYSCDRGGDWNQITVTKEEKSIICEVWSKQSNNIKRGSEFAWSRGVGDLLFEDSEGKYVVNIINPLYNGDKRFSFQYLEIN